MTGDTRHDQHPEVLYHELNSQELIQRASDGDIQAMEQVYFNYRDQLLRYVWLVTGNQEFTTSTVKQVFETLFEDLKNWSSGQHVRTYLYHQATEFVSDQQRDPVSRQSNWNVHRESFAGEGDWTGPGSDHDVTRTAETFVDCFSALPAPLRTAAGLHLFGRFSADEMSEVTGSSPNAVRARTDEALRRLRVCMQPDDDPKTHTKNCSLASERTWLNFLSNQPDSTEPAGESDLSAHVDSCEECRAVVDGVRIMQEHISEIKDLDLPPFPKGDESDLLSEVRTTASSISDGDAGKTAMDPDLKQVLCLIPWGLGLVVLLAIIPFIFGGQHETQSSSPVSSTEATVQASFRRTITLQTGNRELRSVRLRISLQSGVIDSVETVHPDSILNFVRSADSSSKEHEQTKIISVLFRQPFPSGQIRVVDLYISGTGSEVEPPLVNIEEASDPSGNPVDVRSTIE